MCNGSEPPRFERHRGPVTSVAAIPFTRRVATSAYDGAVATFCLDTGTAELLGYHRHLVNRVVVAADGRTCASCSSDYTIQLWDLEARQCTRILRGHSDDVEDFVFLGEGRGASASRDDRIIVWDLATGAIVCIIDDHDDDVLALAYHDGRIYSSGDDRTLRVWSAEDGRPLGMWGPFEHETDTCAIDPTRGRVILGCDDGALRVFDVATGRLVRAIKAHGSGIKKVSTAPNGNFLSAAYDQRILVWDGEALEVTVVLDNVRSKWERSFGWSVDGSRIFAGTFDGTVLEWDVRTGASLREVGEERNEGNSCFNRVASARGAIACVSDDGFVRTGSFVDAPRWLDRAAPSTGRILMNAVAMNEAGSRVVTGSHDQKLHVFRVDDGVLREECELELGEGPINAIAPVARGPHAGELYVACYSGKVIRVSADGTVLDRRQLHAHAVKAIRIHPDGHLAATSSADGELVSWSVPDIEPVRRFGGHDAIINDLDLDLDGTRLASVGRDFKLNVHDLTDGRLLRTFSLGRRSLKSVCFWSADVVIVGDYWGSVIRVDLATGEVLRRAVATNGISCLVRGEGSIVAASYDGIIYALSPHDLETVGRLQGMRQRSVA